MPTFLSIISPRSRRMAPAVSLLASFSVTALSASDCSATKSDVAGLQVAPLAYRLADSPARRPNTMQSSKEFPPSRLAPCTPVEAHSPAA